MAWLGPVVRLGHFSDVHITQPPLSEGWKGLWGKRLAGSANYWLGGRGRHFDGSAQRLEALLLDLEGQSVDHGLCTGDLTQMSFEGEFERCAQAFGPRLRAPERWTVIPGNHDRYTPEAAGRFERWFGPLSAPEGYPWVRRLGDGVVLVCIDVARPVTLLDSSGLCGHAQLRALRDVLSQQMDQVFVIVALHYGLLRADGGPDRPHHGIRDYAGLLALFDDPETRVDLVVHGHLHRPFLLPRSSYAIACAGSATDLAYGGTYQIIDVPTDRGRASIERRRWNGAAWVADTRLQL